MNCNNVKPGIRIKVVRDDGTDGMLLPPENLKTRQVGAVGTVIDYAPGHGGDVWFVRQNNGIAAYCFTKIEIVS